MGSPLADVHLIHIISRVARAAWTLGSPRLGLAILWALVFLGPQASVSLENLSSRMSPSSQLDPPPHPFLHSPSQSCLEGDLQGWAKEKLRFRPGTAMSVWESS